MARILLVEDDPLVRETLQRALAAAGHDLQVAVDGREALTLLEQSAYDLLITDIIMPDTDGIETIIHARRTHPAMPLIAISGGGRVGASDFLGAARKLGASATLAKPFRPTQLLEIVDRLLAGPAAPL
jgi:CheY-like chemotaxis protein